MLDVSKIFLTGWWLEEGVYDDQLMFSKWQNKMLDTWITDSYSMLSNDFFSNIVISTYSSIKITQHNKFILNENSVDGTVEQVVETRFYISLWGESGDRH